MAGDTTVPIRFARVHEAFVGRKMEASPHTYKGRAMDLVRRMTLEKACLRGLTEHIDQMGAQSDRVVSLNLTPWLYDRELNPWAEAFLEETRPLLEQAIEGISRKGGRAVIEVVEGEGAVDPVCNLLLSLGQKMEEKGCAFGLAIDDQYAPGADILRLDRILECIWSQDASAWRPSPLLLKIDHEVLFCLLRLTNSRRQNRRERRAGKEGVATNRSLLLANEDSATGPLTPHPRRGTGSVACCKDNTEADFLSDPVCRNGSQVLRTLALITDHSATARLDANIPYWLVFEGYHGHWEWPEETRSAYRRFLLAAVREALRDIRQPERVLLQG